MSVKFHKFLIGCYHWPWSLWEKRHLIRLIFLVFLLVACEFPFFEWVIDFSSRNFWLWLRLTFCKNIYTIVTHTNTIKRYVCSLEFRNLQESRHSSLLTISSHCGFCSIGFAENTNFSYSILHQIHKMFRRIPCAVAAKYEINGYVYIFLSKYHGKAWLSDSVSRNCLQTLGNCNNDSIQYINTFYYME